MQTLPDVDDIKALVNTALREDIGSGDITAQLIPAGTVCSASILAREAGCLCGQAWVIEIFRQLAGAVELQWLRGDGDHFSKNETLLRLQGDARTILSAERCALNFLQTLSGTATCTAALVASVAHTDVRLLDTRKTLPGLRTAQKYAVRTGGGHNHRMGLFDAFLIKENHIAACGSIELAVAKARDVAPGKPVEIEVQNLSQLQSAIAAGADTVMLDNFDLAGLREAVQQTAGQCQLEASGGIEGGSLVKIAETGVDCISIGALTKHCRAIDLSLLID